MSAEDELQPYLPWPREDVTSTSVLAEFWDDTESDQRNIEVIGWWLSMNPDDGNAKSP